MVYRSERTLDAVFRALADPTRREMLRRLSAGEQSVSELAAPFRMTLAGASKHLKVCENAGLVRRTVRGRVHYCRLDPRALVPAHEWIRFYERFWNERFDALDALLQKRREKSPHPQSPRSRR